MPRPGSSARRYAQTVFEIASEGNRLDPWLEELRALAQAAADPQLAALLRSPRFPLAVKRQTLQEALPDLSQEAINLAMALVIRGRLEALAARIVEQYEALLDQHRGIVRVEVVTAVELDHGELDQIARQLSQITGKQSRLVHRVDPSVIGGMVIRIGDQVIDGTVRGRLEGLRRSLVRAAA